MFDVYMIYKKYTWKKFLLFIVLGLPTRIAQEVPYLLHKFECPAPYFGT